LSQKDLGDVLKVLDGATNSILDQTDHINTLLTKDSLDKVAISEAVMKICESCNFQDLTGQRLTRIMQNLARFENSVSAILNAIIGKDIKNRADKKLEYANDSLMNGPEFLEEAPKQKNIDDIFGS
jgi:chemotaxis protein CheZ